MKKVILLLSVFILTHINLAKDKDFLSDIKLKLKEKNNSFALKQPSYNSKENRPNDLKYFYLDSLTLKSKKKTKNYKVDPLKMTVLAVVGVGVFTGMHIYYSNTWWKEQRDYFKYAQDGYYARNMDKASHVFTANFFTEASAVAYEWTGIHPDKALLYGAITSMAYETYIEINDGFAPNWGFDWGDMGANLFGAVYPFIQKAAPVLENVNFKWSFQPGWIKKKAENSDDLLDDYTNMTFWLSVNPEFIFSKKVTQGKFYPNFLALALGMSVKNASHVTGSTYAYTEWFISLDWDIRKLPGDSDFMKKLKKLLNFYHFPAPAVRISPSAIWYGLYF
jgi:hypothetical protein